MDQLLTRLKQWDDSLPGWVWDTGELEFVFEDGSSLMLPWPAADILTEMRARRCAGNHAGR